MQNDGSAAEVTLGCSSGSYKPDYCNRETDKGCNGSTMPQLVRIISLDLDIDAAHMLTCTAVPYCAVPCCALTCHAVLCCSGLAAHVLAGRPP